MRLLLTVLAVALIALPLAACCGSSGPGSALVLRNPIGFQQELQPEPVRVTPSYSVPSWSPPVAAPQMPAPSYAPSYAPGCAPSYAPPAASPCSPISYMGGDYVHQTPPAGYGYDPLTPTPSAAREMAALSYR